MKLVKGETKPGGKRNKPLRKGIAMRTLLTWTTALVIGLSANARTFAGGPGGKGGSGSHGSHGSHSSNGSNSSHAHVITGNHNSSYSLHHSFKNGSTKSATYHNYHLTHGKKLGKNGYCYPGKYHNHWKYCCFNFNFGCYLYLCPCTSCWYYYCVPDCCYYPVWYVPYRIYCWGVPACYCTAPCPPASVVLPEPVEVVDPTE